MNIFKDLKWENVEENGRVKVETTSLLHTYTIRFNDREDAYETTYHSHSTNESGIKYKPSIKECKEWVEQIHYPSKILQHIKSSPLSIYELRLEYGDESYLSLGFSTSEDYFEKLIDDVREYEYRHCFEDADKDYSEITTTEDVNFTMYYEENHPLVKYLPTIQEHRYEHSFEENIHSFKDNTWATRLSIVQRELEIRL